MLPRQIQLSELVLCVLILLTSRPLEQLHRFADILWHIFSGKVQLGKGILCELISEVSRKRQPLHGSRNILGNILPGQIEPAELIGRIFIFLFCR